MDGLHEPDSHRDLAAAERLRRVSRGASLAAGTIGALALAGWVLGNRWLRSAGGSIEVQPNTGVAILLAATAMLLSTAAGAGLRTVARLLAAVAAAIGGATLAEYVTGVDLGIDRLLYRSDVALAGTSSPGRMGPLASVNLLVAGLGILALDVRVRGARLVAQVLALGVSPLPLLAVVGYAYDVSFVSQPAPATAIAFPTAVALLLLDVAILLARPDRGFVADLATSGTGGALARRMLLYALALPFALGWVALAASDAGPGGAVAVSFLAVAVTLVLVVLVLRDASVLDRMEAAKERAQVERQLSKEELAAALRREQEARAHAEAASRAKDQFLTTLSHELRTPLNAILGWTRLLRDGPPDADRLERGLVVVERNGRALAQVVSDLLDMSRIARGVIQLERGEVDVAAAVSAAIEAVRPTAEARRVRLVPPAPAALPPVEGDAGRIQQIAWNLLSNAVKFTPAGGRIAVSLAADGGCAVLTVEDTGAGIAPEFLPHVFERFRQADGSAARQHGGLGLGLALTRELVMLHGGTIEAASAGVGRGATFRVAFPAVAPVPEQLARAPLGGRPGLENARILVVDDETDSRELLLQLLASWGACVTGAASAREALEAVARERPDLLVSDIAMPGADGFALIQELRRWERALGHLPLAAVALTAFARPEDRRRALAAGFDAHLPKPVEPDALRATLAALVRREEPPAAQPAHADGVAREPRRDSARGTDAMLALAAAQAPRTPA
jgi:signal transduction histidine kinase/CheY-like chemotaxis protein